MQPQLFKIPNCSSTDGQRKSKIQLAAMHKKCTATFLRYIANCRLHTCVRTDNVVQANSCFVKKKCSPFLARLAISPSFSSRRTTFSVLSILIVPVILRSLDTSSLNDKNKWKKNIINRIKFVCSVSRSSPSYFAAWIPAPWMIKTNGKKYHKQNKICVLSI